MNYLNKARSFLKKPHNVILVSLAFILTYLTVIPMITIILDTFTVHQSELMRVKGAKVGDFTLYHWTKVLFSSASKKIFYEPFLNTMFVSFGTCFIAIFLGGLVAWLVTRTNIKYKGIISTLFIFPYIMPSWTLAMAWLNFFKNSRVGGSPGLFTSITGIETANWFAYGPFPIIVVLGLHYAPFAYILIGGILRNMDANLEEAALILKASRAKIMRKITIPIVLPAMLSTFLLVFSSAMSAFAVPAFLGTTVRYQVLTTQMYRTLNGLNPGYGYIMALLMIAIGILILGVNQWIIGTRRSFTTITGKSSNISLINLRGFRSTISVIVLGMILLVCIVPLISFAVESFIMEPGNYSFSNFTTLFWVGAGDPSIANSEPGILRNPSIYKGLWNSIRLSLLVSLISGSVGILAGYAIVKKKNTKLSLAVNNLAFFPYLMPSMAFGAIYLSMFAVKRGFIPPMYGSFALLVLVGSVKYLPFASRASVGAMHQLSNEIEEAGIIQGIPWRKRMMKIIIPIQKSSFLSGYLLPFISCMRELSLFILLVTPATKILTTMLFQYNEKGWSQYANAINLLIVLFVVLSNVIVNRITGASIDKGIGGQ
ncbi:MULTISPECIES: iron ABC transporter permease [unclassified Oceanispirochaeta]|uniref:ABC transporter permease n=1 Tax=unclassified Oceanispirochaeta TaxID=2635722 RepID=UPI000E09C3C1|nr:iron ABC transporter permease [Oceanispirochaeta sp. M1]MBF9016830.1 iron ABC transporter permease [Oceanispirochaeta sp. M2]NPD73193.1 iron ABC transporter permease [Oceanispirochaeta sp. M1]RDG31061.1 iron ABC transporter permease [Oceanispirochaeta sp. M1]